MSRIIKLKNMSGADADWHGQTILSGEYQDISEEVTDWAKDSDVFNSVGNGDLIVCTGADTIDDINDPIKAWNWILGDTMPTSDLGDKLAVHSSSKPIRGNKEYYLQFTGAGDDLISHEIGEGELMVFGMNTGTSELSKEMFFDPIHGDVFLHTGYIKWQNGGGGDSMSAYIVAEATAMQTSVDLDYELNGVNVVYASGGAGTGTHGFAESPKLLPRTHTKDGNWDYDGVNLTPNFDGTGQYIISTVETVVHRYINNMPLCFNSSGYVPLLSDETGYIPPGYFIRITCHNKSNTDWSAAIMVQLYREKTYY